MHWWVGAVDALGRLEAALGSAEVLLRAPVATGWRGVAAMRFTAVLEDEVAAVRTLGRLVPPARVAVQRQVLAAERAVREAREA